MARANTVKVPAENRARMLAMGQEERLAVCEEVMEAMAGGETLAQWCIARQFAPNTVRRWIAEDEKLKEQYFSIRQLQAQAFADEALRVARATTNYSSAADRILIDTLRWAAAKASPAEFGDRQMVEHKGGQVLEIRVSEESMPVRNEKAMSAGMQVVARLAMPEERTITVETPEVEVESPEALEGQPKAPEGDIVRRRPRKNKPASNRVTVKADTP